jgi:acetylglutamate kinase
VTRVIKVGGRVQEDPRLASELAKIWHAGAFPLVVVHGGGDAVTRLQKAFGVEARFEGGRRVTSEQDIELVRMALSGVANKQLVSALVSEGVRAVGISGEDDGLIGATPMDPKRFGHVGEVTTIRPALIHELIGAGLLPVISPVSRNATGTLGPALNVNGDDAAAVLAIALEATELLLVSDVPGVLIDGRVAGSLTSEHALALISDGTAVKGMAAKLEAAVIALEGGVPRVRICDLEGMSHAEGGTTLTVGAPLRRPLSSSASEKFPAAALNVGGLS